MTKIILNGCNGKMGRVISKLVALDDDKTIVAGIDINTEPQNPYPVYKNANEVKEEADVIIDFSHPSAFYQILDFAKAKKLPIIIATTGLTDENKKAFMEASKEIPVFFSANMSLGINLLIELSKKATKLLAEKFDIEIVEKHHNQKIDAPSGTALALADAISQSLSEPYEYTYDRHTKRQARKKKEIGLHAIRGGNIVGEHEVIFAGNDEVVELKHSATSKEVFAVGAIKAGQFMKGKPVGFYQMSDLIGDM